MKTLAIVGAGCWAIYTFVWKEIVVPQGAPAVLVLEVAMQPVSKQRAGGRAARAGLMEMELQMIATNPGDRTLYLLPNYWKLSAIQLQKQIRKQGFSSRANKALSGPSLDHVERDNLLQAGPILATGRLFADDFIQPQEKITRNLIVRVPVLFPVAMVELLVPALTKPPTKALLNGSSLVWNFHGQEGIQPMLCSPSPTAQPEKTCVLSNPAAIDRQLKAFDPRAFVSTQSRQVAP
jgi:hypothetical protein